MINLIKYNVETSMSNAHMLVFCYIYIASESPIPKEVKISHCASLHLHGYLLKESPPTSPNLSSSNNAKSV